MNRKLYLISYDLMSPGRDYSKLYAALQALGGQRVLLSQWVVKVAITVSARNLLDHLLQFIDANDRLLVNDFSDWASYKAMIDLNKAA